ncbi:MAG TPA: hypothetical protein VNO50_08565 [Pyrinomonadaceae bacterium]|nr:hypothetical protein [Pyrinomonadaceae bacterium]
MFIERVSQRRASLRQERITHCAPLERLTVRLIAVSINIWLLRSLCHLRNLRIAARFGDSPFTIYDSLSNGTFTQRQLQPDSARLTEGKAMLFKEFAGVDAFTARNKMPGASEASPLDLPTQKHVALKARNGSHIPRLQRSKYSLELYYLGRWPRLFHFAPSGARGSAVR